MPTSACDSNTDTATLANGGIVINNCHGTSHVCRTPHFFFFFNDAATTEISTLPLPDALPISADQVVTDTATITDADLVVTGGSYTFSATEGSATLSNVTVATFSEIGRAHV